MNPIGDQAVTLMFYGMGTVFVFLTVLVLVTSLMSRLVARFPAPPEPVRKLAKTPDESPQVRAIREAFRLHYRKS
jgi:oxaloacetate decarboxylase (Na+ extruding) subunit gamma